MLNLCFWSEESKFLFPSSINSVRIRKNKIQYYKEIQCNSGNEEAESLQVSLISVSSSFSYWLQSHWPWLVSNKILWPTREILMLSTNQLFCKSIFSNNFESSDLWTSNEFLYAWITNEASKVLKYIINWTKIYFYQVRHVHNTFLFPEECL